MSIKAMKQALEALYPISHNSTDDYRGQADKAIAALRTAIEAVEKQEPAATVVGKFLTSRGYLRTCIEPELPFGTKLYTTPQPDNKVNLDHTAKQISEPVAWMHNSIDGNVIAHRPADLDRHPERWTALYKEPSSCPTCEALSRAVMMDQTSHDTTPQPRREWVGLTDEDVMELFTNLVVLKQDYKDPVDAFKAICVASDAKLREKNT